MSQPMKTRLPVIEDHVFGENDLVGGDVVLDFVNTMTGRNGQPRDWLATFAGLADWAAIAGILDHERHQALKKRSRRYSSEVNASLQFAREVRELLFEVLSHLVGGNRAPEAALTRLHVYWSDSISRHRLQNVDRQIQLAPASASMELSYISDVIIVRAVELLRNIPHDRVRMCSGPDCAWLFVDTSKAGRRRWCDMSTCGNDAKAKRFHLAKRSNL